MSRERARRRAEREAQAAKEAERRAVRQARRARRQRLIAWIPRPSKRPRTDSVLARKRRIQNRIVAAVFLGIQVIGWIILQSWTGRLVLLALSLFLIPVAVTLAFDRRS